MNIENIVTNYCDDVINGTLESCEFTRWACMRFNYDVSRIGDNFDYVLDWTIVDRFVAFCLLCKHYKGECAGQPFIPSKFQLFCAANIFGWVHKVTGKRRFAKAYLKWPRKTGKTFFAAVIGCFMFFADNEAAPDIYCAATKIDQAKEAYEAAFHVIRASEVLRNNCKLTSLAITSPDGGKIKPLSSDSKTLDGLNPHGAILDEIHAYKNTSLIDVIESGTGARTQPLLIMITSGGHVTDGADDIMMESAKSCLDPNSGINSDLHDNVFYFVLKLDPKEKWDNPKNYLKVNPNIGVSVQPDFYEKKLAAVKNGTFSEAEFRTKFLSQTLRGGQAWINIDEWDKCKKDIDFSGLGTPLMSCDFSKTRDLTACVLSWFDGENLTLKPYFFAPDECVADESENNKMYRQWSKKHDFILTPGSTIDFNIVGEIMFRECEEYGCDSFGYDLRFGDDIAKRWEDKGLTPFPLPSQSRYITSICDRFEQLILTGKIKHDGNPILRWNIANMVKKYIGSSEMMYLPYKAGRYQKIDGGMASIYGLYMWLSGKFDYLLDDGHQYGFLV